MNQYCEIDSTTQSKLESQCNPCQDTNGMFHRITTKIFTVYVETQKNQNSQSHLKNEKLIWNN